MKQNDTILNADEYFAKIKAMKNSTTDEELDKFLDSSLILLKKYKTLGQKEMMRKLMFIIDCIPKERELVKMGIDVFLYKDDIEEFINSVENKVVKIIELKNYPREIPDELLPVVEKTKDIFDEFYVLFTDYTGKVERKVEADRRAKDPILFGCFVNDRLINDRMYYLGDWEDKYCDLTLEKLIKIKGEDIVKTIGTPIDKEELILECDRLLKGNSSSSSGWFVSNNISYADTVDNTPTSKTIKMTTVKDTKKNGFFKRIKAVFKGE